MWTFPARLLLLAMQHALIQGSQLASEDVRRQVEAKEAQMLVEGEHVECPLRHDFAPGVYLRTVLMPAGVMVIGHEHKTRHFNVVHSGKARVLIGGAVADIVAPCIFVSEPGVRKVLLILESMEWSTIHPTHETDLAKLEELLIIKSQAFLHHHERLALMSANDERTEI